MTIFPMLSIVMPVYNKLGQTLYMIESIRANRFQLWELLVVDDGSDEDTITVLNQLSCKDSRIKIIRRNRSPKGAQTCRNIGMEQAKGKYIIFFDNDDYVLPYCLETRVGAMESNPLLDFMVFPTGVIIDDVYTDVAHQSSYGYPIYKDDLDAFARRQLPFVVWNNIYRVDSLRMANIKWDENLLSLQDADFNVRTIVAGLKYSYFDCPADLGYRIGQRKESVSKKFASLSHKNSTLYAIEKYYRMYKDYSGDKYNSALYNGVLFLYNRAMADGIDVEYARLMVQAVKRNSIFYGTLLSLAVRSSMILQTIMPNKYARQIPMVPYLIEYRHRIKDKITKIRKLKKQ